MRHELHTEIEIEAPPETVWQVLTDLDAYDEWNPFIISASGRAAVGERMTARFQPPGGRATTLKPTITEVESGSVFEWLGRIGFPGVFDARHRFELHPSERFTRVVHSEYFSGVLVRFFRKSLDTSSKSGFEALNNALKSRAEARVRSER